MNKGYLSNMFGTIRQVSSLKPPKPPDETQNVMTVRPLSKNKWVRAHWRWNYTTQRWEWVIGHWS